MREREEAGLTNGTLGCVRRGLAVGTLLSRQQHSVYSTTITRHLAIDTSEYALHQPYTRYFSAAIRCHRYVSRLLPSLEPHVEKEMKIRSAYWSGGGNS